MGSSVRTLESGITVEASRRIARLTAILVVVAAQSACFLLLKRWA